MRLPQLNQQLDGALKACFEAVSKQVKAGAYAFKNTLVTAVSGGSDSVALAHTAQRFATQNALHHHCVIINHNIRPEAADEARLVATELSRHHIECHIIDITAPAPRTGIQEWARQQRYDALLGYCEKFQAMLLLGHHADDQAETVLMRLSKGSGIDGLAGMKMLTSKRDIVCLRPFLGLPKSALSAYCTDNHLSFVEDKSNLDLRFERVRLRQFLAHPAAQGFSPQALRLSQLMGRLTQHLNTPLSAWLHRFGKIDFALQIRLNREAFDKLAPIAQAHLLRVCVMGVGSAHYPVGFMQIEHALSQLQAGTASTCGGCYLHAKKSDYIIQAEWGRHAPKPIVTQPAQTYSFDGRWQVYTSIFGKIMRYGQLREDYPVAAKQIAGALSDRPARIRDMIPCMLGLDGKALPPHLKYRWKQAPENLDQTFELFVIWPLEFPELLQNAALAKRLQHG